MEGMESPPNLGSSDSQVEVKVVGMASPAPSPPPLASMAMSPTLVFPPMSTPMFNTKTSSKASVATFHGPPLLVLDQKIAEGHVFFIPLVEKFLSMNSW